MSHSAAYPHTDSTGHCLQVAHESTLNIKLAAASTLQSIPLPPSLSPPKKRSISTFSGWEEEGKGTTTIIIIILFVVMHMHACVYVCLSVRWLASGMHANAFHLLCASHGNVVRTCANATLSGPCNVCLMIDDCDE